MNLREPPPYQNPENNEALPCYRDERNHESRRFSSIDDVQYTQAKRLHPQTRRECETVQDIHPSSRSHSCSHPVVEILSPMSYVQPTNYSGPPTDHASQEVDCLWNNDDADVDVKTHVKSTRNFMPRSPLKKSPPSEDIVPSHNDVILGRGGKMYQHHGNERLRRLTYDLRHEYAMATKKYKTNMSRKLVETVHCSWNPPGRFIERSKTGEMWVVVSPSQARDKVAQCFRDAVAGKNLPANVPLIPTNVKESIPPPHRQPAHRLSNTNPVAFSHSPHIDVARTLSIASVNDSDDDPFKPLPFINPNKPMSSDEFCEEVDWADTFRTEFG